MGHEYIPSSVTRQASSVVGKIKNRQYEDEKNSR